jgi:hypothetical protein
MSDDFVPVNTADHEQVLDANAACAAIGFMVPTIDRCIAMSRPAEEIDGKTRLAMSKKALTLDDLVSTLSSYKEIAVYQMIFRGDYTIVRFCDLES